jgi:hypothetical protein
MRDLLEIENIEEMRRREGIDDVELREEIRGLAIGDRVKITLLLGTESAVSETVVVRITSIRESAYRGKLVNRPLATRLSRLRAGWPVVFTAAHIHSIPKGPPAHGR